MSVILDSEAVIGNTPVVVDKRVRLLFNTNISADQRKSGIIAKVQILHPAFSTRVTIWENEKGTRRVSGSSLKTGEGNTSKDYFNIVLLEPGFRDYIMNEFKAYEEGKQTSTGEAWYLNVVGKHGPTPTATKENTELDIEEITLAANLSDKQKEVGMVCKVQVKTPIATLRGISVFQSQFGQSLYLTEQTEDTDGKIPGYKLSREAEAQVLGYIHSFVKEWGEAPKPRQRNAAQDAADGDGDFKPNAQGTFNEEEYFEQK